MANDDQQEITRVTGRDLQRQLSGKTILYASAAGVMLSGPLLGLTGLSLFGTLALLAVAFPLFFLFSPVLVGFVLVIAASVAAFSAAGVMAVAGMAALGWAFKQVWPDKPVGLPTRVVEKLVENERIKC